MADISDFNAADPNYEVPAMEDLSFGQMKKFEQAMRAPGSKYKGLAEFQGIAGQMGTPADLGLILQQNQALMSAGGLGYTGGVHGLTGDTTRFAELYASIAAAKAREQGSLDARGFEIGRGEGGARGGTGASGDAVSRAAHLGAGFTPGGVFGPTATEFGVPGAIQGAGAMGIRGVPLGGALGFAGPAGMLNTMDVAGGKALTARDAAEAARSQGHLSPEQQAQIASQLGQFDPYAGRLSTRAAKRGLRGLGLMGAPEHELAEFADIMGREISAPEKQRASMEDIGLLGQVTAPTHAMGYGEAEAAEFGGRRARAQADPYGHRSMSFGELQAAKRQAERERLDAIEASLGGLESQGIGGAHGLRTGKEKLGITGVGTSRKDKRGFGGRGDGQSGGGYSGGSTGPGGAGTGGMGGPGTKL